MKVSASNHAGSIYLNPSSSHCLQADYDRILQDARHRTCAVCSRNKLQCTCLPSRSFACYSAAIDTLEHLPVFSIAVGCSPPAL
jgi:hypothetical protein